MFTPCGWVFRVGCHSQYSRDGRACRQFHTGISFRATKYASIACIHSFSSSPSWWWGPVALATLKTMQLQLKVYLVEQQPSDEPGSSSRPHVVSAAFSTAAPLAADFGPWQPSVSLSCWDEPGVLQAYWESAPPQAKQGCSGETRQPLHRHLHTKKLHPNGTWSETPVDGVNRVNPKTIQSIHPKRLNWLNLLFHQANATAQKSHITPMFWGGNPWRTRVIHGVLVITVATCNRKMRGSSIIRPIIPGRSSSSAESKETKGCAMAGSDGPQLTRRLKHDPTRKKGSFNFFRT